MKPTVRILISAMACLSLASLAQATPASRDAGSSAAVFTSNAIALSPVVLAGGPSLDNPGPVCSGLKLGCAAGDFNGNGVVSPSDLALWLDEYFTPTGAAAYDLDGSGSLTAADLAVLICLYFGCL